MHQKGHMMKKIDGFFDLSIDCLIFPIGKFGMIERMAMFA
jgi:hypothetical protein